MWSDRKQDDLSSRRAGALDNKSEPGVSLPTHSRVASLAVIGQGMVIRGQITSREDIRVDGEVDGSLNLPEYSLTVGPHGKVGAGATAREVDVAGNVTGNVQASKKVTIRTGGSLIGDLRTPGIVIEDGAYFKGKIEIVGSEQPAESLPIIAEPKTTATGA